VTAAGRLAGARDAAAAAALAFALGALAAARPAWMVAGLAAALGGALLVRGRLELPLAAWVLFLPIHGGLCYSLFVLSRSGLPAATPYDAGVALLLLAFAFHPRAEAFRGPLALAAGLLVTISAAHVVVGAGLGRPTVYSEARGFLYAVLFFPFVAIFRDGDRLLALVRRVALPALAVVVVFAALDLSGALAPWSWTYRSGIRFMNLKEGIPLARRYTFLNPAAALLLLGMLGALLRGRQGTGWERWLQAGGVVFAVIAVLLDETRSFHVGLAVACAVAAVLGAFGGGRWTQRLGSWWLPAVTVGAAAVLWLVEPRLISGGLERWSRALSTDSSVARRVEEVRTFFASFQRAPVLGQGFGAEVSVFAPDAHGYLQVSHAHNEFLTLLHSIGLLGGVAFALLFAGVLLTGLRNLARLRGRPELFHLQVNALAVFLALAVIGTASPKLTDPVTAPLVAALAAATAVLARARPAAAGGGAEAAA
jgi:O-antigen ligase